MIDTECPVCLEKIGEKNNCTTQCGHSFCFSCMIKAMSVNNRCPYCREILIEKNIHEDDFEESDEDEEDDNFHNHNNIFFWSDFNDISHIEDINENNNNDSLEHSTIYYGNKYCPIGKTRLLVHEHTIVKIDGTLYGFNALKNYIKKQIKIRLDTLNLAKLKKYKNCNLKEFLKLDINNPITNTLYDKNSLKKMYNTFFSSSKNVYNFAYYLDKTTKNKKIKKNFISSDKPRFKF
jgi:hypothetical protein